MTKSKSPFSSPKKLTVVQVSMNLKTIIFEQKIYVENPVRLGRIMVQ
ncbi:MAG: hypothetical protein HEQ12_12570 [Aphanizomenon flos-aquae DEX188]|nr:MAG: hypothetical protein HEQ12_12570 [Aphanizomenon flos-aquae DEX188]